MSADTPKPSDGAPTIDSLLKSANWEARLAEARVKREKVLAAKDGAPKVSSEPQVNAQPMIKIKTKPKPVVHASEARHTDQSPPRTRLRLRWIFLGVGVVICAAAVGALMLWVLIR